MSWVLTSGNSTVVTYFDQFTDTYNLKAFGPTGGEIAELMIGSGDKFGRFGLHSYGYSTSDNSGGIHFVWVDDSDGDDEIYYTQIAGGEKPTRCPGMIARA